MLPPLPSFEAGERPSFCARSPSPPATCIHAVGLLPAAPSRRPGTQPRWGPQPWGFGGSLGQLSRADKPGAEPWLIPLKRLATLCGEGRCRFQPQHIVISLKVSIISGLKKQKLFFACLYFSPHQYWGQAGHFQTVPGAYSAIKDRNYIFITQDIAARLFMTCSISRIFILDREPDNFHPIYFS